mgnify:CR=1 FL=1
MQRGRADLTGPPRAGLACGFEVEWQASVDIGTSDNRGMLFWTDGCAVIPCVRGLRRDSGAPQLPRHINRMVAQVSALHPLENHVITSLQAEMKMRHQARLVCDQRQQIIIIDNRDQHSPELQREIMNALLADHNIVPISQ